MTVQSMVREFRVREKLLLSGAQSLSDMELLAAFISAGSKDKSCMQVACDVIHHLGNMRQILNTDFPTFNRIQGLGLVRYVQLQAAREICRRSDFIYLQQDIQLKNSQETSFYLKRRLRDKKHETVAALFLDSQHRILAYEEIFTGSINTAVIYIRPIIQRVLAINAAAIVLAHNHPSGLSDPSPLDQTVTEHLQQGLALVDARLLDHLVVGDNEVYSILSGIKWSCH